MPTLRGCSRCGGARRCRRTGLALVSVSQFAEGLTDRQATHAVRSRLDRKYARSLEPADAGFDFSVLSEFRARSAEADTGRVVFDAVLGAAGEVGLVGAGKRQRTDATHVLAATRDLNRLEFVVQTLRAALNHVAVAAGTGWRGWRRRSGSAAAPPGRRTAVSPPGGQPASRTATSAAPTAWHCCKPSGRPGLRPA